MKLIHENLLQNKDEFLCNIYYLAFRYMEYLNVSSITINKEINGCKYIISYDNSDDSFILKNTTKRTHENIEKCDNKTLSKFVYYLHMLNFAEFGLHKN